MKHLSNAEIIQKVVEGPKKLKKNAKGFLQVLLKHGVYLDDEANVVYDNVGDQNIVNFLEKQESLVKVTLMQADLDFEYP